MKGKNMSYSDYEYLNSSDEAITRELLYSNATFDIKKVLSDATALFERAVSVITPSQIVNVAFEHNGVIGHAGITDIILSRIYPHYVRNVDSSDPKVFFDEGQNNIFILLTNTDIFIIVPDDRKINQSQYNQLRNYIAEIKKSEYIKNGKIKEIFFDSEIVPIDEIDGIMEEMRNNISEKDMPKQYDISQFDFSDCENKAEIMERARLYARIIEERRSMKKVSSGDDKTVKEPLDQNRVTTEERVREFEKRYKDEIFEKIGDIASEQTGIIIDMAISTRKLGRDATNIPNVAITVNNKLIELSQEFEKAGISMFSSKAEDTDIISSSFIGDAIMQDLIKALAEADDKLNEYIKVMKNLINQKLGKLQWHGDINPVKKFFTIMNPIPINPQDVSLTEKEQRFVEQPLTEYGAIDDKIAEYNLKNNIVGSIVRFIRGKRYDASLLPRLLEEEVIPDFKRLGLEGLIPELKQSLIEEYKKDVPGSKSNQVKPRISPKKKVPEKEADKSYEEDEDIPL